MANKKWLKDARKKMEQRGTIGAFTQYCGGSVTNECIERGLNSNNPLTRKRAQFAKNVRKMQAGGPMQPMQPMQPIQPQAVPQLPNAMPTQELQASTSNVADSVEQGGGGDASGYQAAGQLAAMAGDAVTASSVTDKGKTTGQIASGAGKGAASGAAIGTMIFPGIGTAIGAGIGAIAGGISGGVKQKKANEAASDQRMAQTQALANQYQQSKYGSFARYYGGGMVQPGDPIPTNKDGFNVTPQNTVQVPTPGFQMQGTGNTTVQLPGAQGATQLPGGVQMPIGFGVDKFVGNKHDQAGMGSPSGIILEEGGKSKPGIEVEDGELQTDVKTKKGKKDYIVSDHVVNPATGNTLAEDMEKEIKAAKSKKQADQIKQKYVKLNEELKDDGKPGMIKAENGEFTGGALSAEEAKVGEQTVNEEGLYGEASGESLEELKKRNPWYDFSDFDPNDPESVKDFQREYNKRAPEDKQVVVDGKYGTQTDSIRLNTAPEKMTPKGPATNPEQEKELQGEMQELAPQTGKKTPPQQEEEAKKDDDSGEETMRLRPTGTMIQALGPAFALSQSLTPQKVRPEYIDAPTLRRENYDRERSEERANLAATGQAASRAMSGPAAFAARQSAAAQSAGRQRQITSAEGRANRQIADQEKRLQMQADQANVNAFMRADSQNVAAANRAQEVNQRNKIAAVNQLGRIGTQAVVDRNQQRADVFAGQSQQIDGEFDRALKNYYKSSRLPFGPKVNINTQGGTTMSQDQIDAMYAQQLAEAEQTKKGGYIRKNGKVRRNRRKKK